MATTITRSNEQRERPQAGSDLCTALTMVACAAGPFAGQERRALAPARHRIDGVVTVRFTRGPRGATRDGDRGLTLSIPDPYQSKDQGRLVRLEDRWVIESPASKNGVAVNGCVTRYGTVQLGDVIEVGRCVFVVERLRLPCDGPLDHTLDPGAHAQPQLASLHPGLVTAEAVLAQIARSANPVLLHGETGTGKEVYARALHHASRRTGPFVAVNCGALTPSLLEAELFGHRKGTFSGATADRAGYVRASHGGTLFLDEITALSESGQVALLRVLQENEVVAVGDTRAVPVDLRLCAASQLPLIQEVEAGRFRNDLYGRLFCHELHLPPLRERRCDLGHLIDGLLRRTSARPVEITSGALRLLIEYDWPRNVRELERCLAAAVVLASGGPIDVPHLPATVRAHRRAHEPAGAPPPLDLDAGERALRAQLAAKLAEHRGNISAVARELGKHREQIQRLIRRFGFDVDLFRRGDDEP
ncbi:MAG TPA: sigma 54-interacting transcriptional regulator [Kofleriaceae bacterium]|nr:sigma 54-interacting transcriptional regulator [Kofleriaceae bacterium]